MIMNMKTIQKILALVLMAIVTLPAVAQEERTIKRKVAIGRFSNETQYSKGLFYDKENDPMRKQALDILSSKLASTGKFILLEREDLDILDNFSFLVQSKLIANDKTLRSTTRNNICTVFNRKNI